MKQLVKFLFILIFFSVSLPAWGQSRSGSSLGFTHRGIHNSIRSSRAQPLNPLPQNLPLYNPYFSIYFGPLYEPYDEPCYYDEYYGQWVGPCTTSLDTPGYSITIPNRVR